MRERSAFGLVSEIKTFIAENSSKKNHPDEFVTIIRTFLDQTNSKLAQHELWKGATDEELDNAAEGLEKYLMNKMYKACFQPIASDDALRDQALSDRLSLLSFIKPAHLDIPAELCDDKAIPMAMKELCKIDTYKAPRDKMVCVLNTCKIINNILQSHSDKVSGADEFFPLLVYVVLQSKPPNLHSNVHFIQRFRSPDKLRGEAGYYFTNLQGAIEFVQCVDASKLSITQEEFDIELNKALASRDLEDSSLPPLGNGDSAKQVTESSAVVANPAPSAPLPPAESATGNLIELGTNTPPTAVQQIQDDLTRGISLIDFPSVDVKQNNIIEGNPISVVDQSKSTFGSSVAQNEASHIFGSEPAPTFSSATDDSKKAPSLLQLAGSPRTNASSPLNFDLSELMGALEEPPVAKFTTCNVEELTMTDIPLLLADYKRIAKLAAKIKDFFGEQPSEGERLEV